MPWVDPTRFYPSYPATGKSYPFRDICPESNTTVDAADHMMLVKFYMILSEMSKIKNRNIFCAPQGRHLVSNPRLESDSCPYVRPYEKNVIFAKSIRTGQT